MSGPPEYIDERHQRIAEFAAEFLDEDEAEGFVDQMLERHGYVREARWSAPADTQQGGGRQPLLQPRQQQGRQPRQQGGQQRGGGQRGSRSGGYFGGGR